MIEPPRRGGISRYGASMIEAMVGQGKVVGGDYINRAVATDHRGDLFIQAGLKRRKLIATEVAGWEDVTGEAGGGSGASGAVGKVIAGAVLPGFIGKVAGAALDATMGSSAHSPRTIRVDWNDGKQSLIRLPDKLFTHVALILKDRKIAAPATTQTGSVAAPHAPQPDVMEQIGKLAALRDQGALTDEEFTRKKAELLDRL